MHRFVQQAFLDSEMQGFNLYRGSAMPRRGTPGATEPSAGPVAVHEEGEDEGHEMTIYVGEVKSAVDECYASGKTYVQLATYVADFRALPPHAIVAPLSFWNPDAGGYPLGGDGYACKVFITNAGRGLYRYNGVVKPKDRGQTRRRA